LLDWEGIRPGDLVGGLAFLGKVGTGVRHPEESVCPVGAVPIRVPVFQLLSFFRVDVECDVDREVHATAGREASGTCFLRRPAPWAHAGISHYINRGNALAQGPFQIPCQSKITFPEFPDLIAANPSSN